MGEVDVTGMLARMSSGQFTEWAAWMQSFGFAQDRPQRRPVRVREPKVTVAKTPSEIYRTIKDGLRLGGFLK
jgi:hypothetical protein